MQPILLLLPNFLLIFCRITSFFVVAPIFSTRTVPAPFRIGLSFFITLLVFGSVNAGTPVPLDGNYPILILREVLFGLALGFIAYIFFNVVQVAGAFIDLQMGLGIANVYDPMTGAQSPIMGSLKYIVAILLFLSFNGHHYMLSAIMDSYVWVPIDNFFFREIASGQVSDFMVRSFSTMFALAFQLAAPIVIAMFLTDVGLGALARTAPQFNVFVVGVPVKILVGLVILLLVLPGFLQFFGKIFETLLEALTQLIRMVGASDAAG